MNILQRIDDLEGRRLSDLVVQYPTVHLGRNWRLVKIVAAARPHETLAGSSLCRLLAAQQNFIAGLYATGCPWGFLISGDKVGISVYFALPGVGDMDQAWESRLYSCFPSSTFEIIKTPAYLEQRVLALPYALSITGNPSITPHGNVERRDSAIPQGGLEALLRNMVGLTFSYMVLARPVAHNTVLESFTTLGSDERELVSNFQRRGSAEENNNPQARHCVELIRAARGNHELGLKVGMWDLQAYLRTQHQGDLFFGQQALHPAFSGAGSRPQPIRFHLCSSPTRNGSVTPATRLNTIEAVAFSKLPEEEFPGYQVQDLVRFAVSPPSVGSALALDIGILLDGGRRTPNWFSIPRPDLARHALVVGASGSGKTNTCQHLLLQLWNEHRIPWLVVEPSMKSEYRRLLCSEMRDDLRVFTLGDESGVPFRLNPLEVLHGVHVQTQIDAVLSLFGAAFGWVSPMPEVLNLAMHRLYLDSGWDLAQGIHPEGYTSEAQPVLEDLLRLIPAFVEELGYNAEISSTIRAGLITRLSSLTTGGKGRMLNSGVSIPFDELLSRPAVLELAAIGNDEEKAFVLGAILMRLAHYRQAAGITEGRLQHVLLVEEAHRLLAAPPAHAASEVANPRARAVETFCNLLAEVRAYGQGVVIAEQIPSKLVSDVIKNVNLKIIHRLPAEEDRHLVGATMNLSTTHEKFLASIPVGQAVVFSEGRDLASQLAIPNASFQMRSPSGLPTKAAIVQHMRGRTPEMPEVAARGSAHTRILSVLPLCPGCVGRDCSLRPAILRTMAAEDLAEGFQNAIASGWDALWDFGTSVAARTSVKDKSQAAYCLLLNIALFGKFDCHAIETMKVNLGPKREQAPVENKV